FRPEQVCTPSFPAPPSWWSSVPPRRFIEPNLHQRETGQAPCRGSRGPASPGGPHDPRGGAEDGTLPGVDGEVPQHHAAPGAERTHPDGPPRPQPQDPEPAEHDPPRDLPPAQDLQPQGGGAGVARALRRQGGVSTVKFKLRPNRWSWQ
ncbi:hypothetical protein CRUP_038048, partial [Coryphaenoides rupestris]